MGVEGRKPEGPRQVIYTHFRHEVLAQREGVVGKKEWDGTSALQVIFNYFLFKEKGP